MFNVTYSNDVEMEVKAAEDDGLGVGELDGVGNGMAGAPAAEGEFEGERVAMSSPDSDCRRMTGSALRRYELRGTFHGDCSARLAE